MREQRFSTLIAAQRAYFGEGHTLPVATRLVHLKRLRELVKAREADIAAALRVDLGKSHTESYMCEIGMVLEEISFMCRNLKKLAKPKRVKTPVAQFPAKSYRLPVPLGTVLIMSPWNYPFLLTVGPLVDALAAGNTAIVKPSAYAPATAALLSGLLADCFPAELVTVVTGGRAENAALLEEKFDLVFFTGSQSVGKEVLRHTAETLTPAVLELGGKSPCIVDESANLDMAARRIVFGKYLNCGQTCVAPDYLLVQASVKERLLAAVKREILRQYGESPLTDKDYGKIISEKHFDRLLGLIDAKKVAHGGDFNRETLQIAPTVLDGVTPEDAVMGEEIFGPILPVMTYENLEEVMQFVQGGQKPLALYLFSGNKANINTVTRRIPFGGGCINDTVVHLATTHMPFGGVGESGMGAYHGRVGFEAFSHQKSILHKSSKIDIPLRYRPTGAGALKILRRFMK